MSQTSDAVQITLGAGPSERFSCLICRQRKIKCDRHNPCSHCVKAGIQCSFVAPVRGKRKRTKAPTEGLHEKLRRYEELLKSYGAKIDQSDNGDVSDQEFVLAKPDVEMMEIDDHESRLNSEQNTVAVDASKPRLVTKNGLSKYFDSAVWSTGNIGEEFRHPEEEVILTERIHKQNGQASTPFSDASDEHSFLLNVLSKIDSLASLHPTFPIVQRLWDVFTDRVDPLMKILHLPTFWSSVISAFEDLHNIPKSLESLIFAFYLMAIVSLEESECLSITGEEKSVIAARYRMAARQALVNAEFLRASSLTTLQAFVIFLTAMRGHFPSESIFILSGVSVRLGRRMGLHRDGSLLGLSPFETELRRRLWWQIVIVDCRTSDFSGTKPSMDLFLSDVKPPLNILDEDITPEMASPPLERAGITPLVLSLIKCDLTEFSHKGGAQLSGAGRFDNLTRSDSSLAEKSSRINATEDLLERKYLRYCDPLVPVHYFASIIARSAICKMKLFAYNPRQFAERGEKVPQDARDIIFTNGMKLLEYGNIAHKGEILRKFRCQIGTGYLWDTLLYVLIEARRRKTGPEVDRAWELIGAVFSNYAQGFVDGTDELYAALSSWTLQVWDACVTARKADGLPEPPTPEYIVTLALNRKRDPDRNIENAAGQGEGEAPANDGFQNGESEAADSYDFSNLLSFDLEPSGWDQWERLFGGQVLQ